MSWKRARFLITLAVIAAVAGGIAFAARRRSEPEPQTTTVEKRDLVQEVSVTGRVQARKTVQLALVSAGRVAGVSVDIGDTVRQGAALVTVDETIPSLEVQQAEATRAAALVKAELDAESAEKALQDTRSQHAATLEKRRQAVRDAKVEVDQNETIRQREIIESGDESVKARTALLNLRKAQTTYHAVQEALRESLAEAALADHDATAALERARASLAEIRQAASGTEGPSALGTSVALEKERLSETTVSAPFTGTVTEVAAEIGEVVQAGTPVVTMQTRAPHELVADIPESDAVKLTVGQKAQVTLDAYGSQPSFEATVARIDPAARPIEGVPTFQTTFALVGDDDHIKPGMTATIVSVIAERTGALAIPSRAVVEEDGRALARVLHANGTITERVVKTGIRSSDGFTEVLEGLSAGDRVVTSRAK